MESSNKSGASQWFALRVKSGAEKSVSAAASYKGFEEFLPLYLCRRRWSDRFKSVELPLFPGYVFCRLSPEDRLPLLMIPGAMHFVGIGKIPAPIDDREIGAIQVAMRSGLYAQPYPFLKVGQRVLLEAGPLAGVEGYLLEVRKQHRLVISMTLLMRSVAVEIDRDWVTPLDAEGRRATFPVAPPPSGLAADHGKSRSTAPCY